MRIFAVILFWFLSAQIASAAVLINEIAWMGTTSANDEWIELVNTGNQSVNLAGWTLRIARANDENNIIKDIPLSGTISAKGYLLIERNNISFGTGITNTGAIIVLFNETQTRVDIVDGSDNWKLNGVDTIGDNDTKETAQRDGSLWITAMPTPGAQNVSLAQQSPQTYSTTNNQQEYEAPVELQSTPAKKVVIIEKDPYLIISTIPRTIMAGASIKFSATLYGPGGGVIPYPQMRWSFGDGTIRDGSSVEHIYRYPGEYTVVIDATSGYYSAVDRFAITVVAPQITATTGGEEGSYFISLENRMAIDLNLSGWSLSYAGSEFLVPQNTIIASRKTSFFPSEVTGLATPVGSTPEIRLPSGVSIIKELSPVSIPSYQPPPPQEYIHYEVSPSSPAPFLESSQQASVTQAFIQEEVIEPVPQGQPIILGGHVKKQNLIPWYFSIGLFVLTVMFLFRLTRHGQSDKKEPSEEEINIDEYEIVEEDRGGGNP